MTPREKREILLAYLRLKIEEADWHGVQDAASDLRDLEAACPGLRVMVRE